MNRLVIALALFGGTIPSFVAAQGPQQPVVRMSATISKPRPANGETVRLDVVVTNDGPGAISYLVSQVEVTGGLIVTARCAATAEPSYEHGNGCSVESLAAGASTTPSFDVHLGNSASLATIRGSVVTYSYGKSQSVAPAATEFRIDVPLERPAVVADLAVTATEEPHPIPVDTPITFVTTIANIGPDAVDGVELIAEDPIPRLEPPSNVSGAGCKAVGAHTVCDVGTIQAGGTVTVRYTRPGIELESQERRTVRVIAGRSFDPVAANSELERTLLVGIPAELARVLLPVVIDPTAGANGSLWISEVSMFVDGDDELFVFPTSFPCQVLCPAPAIAGTELPSRRRSQPPLIALSDRPGYLLRFDRARAHELSLTARIRDTSRALDTWGTAIPVVTDDELVEGRLQLVDIAAGPRFRQTLRVYEPDASGASVRIRVYGDAGSEVLLGEESLKLATPPENQSPDRNAGLPFYPGYAQIDFATRFPGAALYPRLRVEIEPLDPTTRYWAFASITNNETQHVTIVSPETGGKD